MRIYLREIGTVPLVKANLRLAVFFSQPKTALANPDACEAEDFGWAIA